jgi:hypothetical protein
MAVFSVCEFERTDLPCHIVDGGQNGVFRR